MGFKLLLCQPCAMGSVWYLGDGMRGVLRSGWKVNGEGCLKEGNYSSWLLAEGQGEVGLPCTRAGCWGRCFLLLMYLGSWLCVVWGLPPCWTWLWSDGESTRQWWLRDAWCWWATGTKLGGCLWFPAAWCYSILQRCSLLPLMSSLTDSTTLELIKCE